MSKLNKTTKNPSFKDSRKLTKDDYCGIFGNPNMTVDVINVCLSMNNALMFEGISSAAVSTPAILKAVYKKSKSYDILFNLAEHKNTPSDLIRELLDRGVEEALANPNISFEVLNAFVKSRKSVKKQEGFFYAAVNPTLTVENQFSLMKKLDEPSRLFFNPNLHPEVFDKLWSTGCHEDMIDATYYGQSENCTREQALMLCRYTPTTYEDEDAWMINRIRSAGYSNQNCPKSTITDGRTNPSDEIGSASFANQALSVDWDLLNYNDRAALKGIASRDDTPEEILNNISKLSIKDDDVHFELVRNHNTPPACDRVFI